MAKSSVRMSLDKQEYEQFEAICMNAGLTGQEAILAFVRSIVDGTILLEQEKKELVN